MVIQAIQIESFKVKYFDGSGKATRDNITLYNNIGIIS